LQQFSKYIVVDAYFSKKPFIDKMVDNNFHVISRLRNDADLKYIFTGEATGKRGRPKKFAGKIDFKNIDKNVFNLLDDNDDFSCYHAMVYSKALERNIKLVFL